MARREDEFKRGPAHQKRRAGRGHRLAFDRARDESAHRVVPPHEVVVNAVTQQQTHNMRIKPGLDPQRDIERARTPGSHVLKRVDPQVPQPPRKANDIPRPEVTRAREPGEVPKDRVRHRLDPEVLVAGDQFTQGLLPVDRRQPQSLRTRARKPEVPAVAVRDRTPTLFDPPGTKDRVDERD